MVPARAELRTYDATVDHAIASWNNVLICIWRDQTLVSACKRLAEVSSEMGAQSSNVIGLFTIIERTAPLPSSEARSTLSSFFNEGDEIAVSAVAFEGEGFRASAVRSVVSGLTMIARQPFPHRVFATISLALEWYVPELVKRTGATFTAMSLFRAISELRQQVEAAHPRPYK